MTKLFVVAEEVLVLLEDMATYSYVKGYPSTHHRVTAAIKDLKEALAHAHEAKEPVKNDAADTLPLPRPGD